MRGLDNAITTIILTGAAVALAIGLSIWVFETSAAASKLSAIKVEPLGAAVGSGWMNLSFIVINDYSTTARIAGVSLGSLTCTFDEPIPVPSNADGIPITINIGSNATVEAITASREYRGNCSGSPTPNYLRGALITANGEEYPFSLS
ncbi:hypothetical protein GCM10007981_13450 [Thermocladium modestius]|uniref:Uncharacterized protein n=1 Tax=Thermocladium modestius TaxID=62609 RepID=A0A830GXV9_9CREN|nr:hypothetical protein [Thermocladium modestius]GGP21476.1 hypothetical protein GCM10007981_13450 [Thermocladium modestius]